MIDTPEIWHRGSFSLPASATVFGLLRHGTTQWNEEKRIQGLGDSPLTNRGKSRTVLWSQHLQKLHWHIILASDLGRVRETVSILNDQLDLPVFFDKRLREQYWGEWEGMRLEVIQESAPKTLQQQIQAGWNFRAPQGESRRSVQLRAEEAIMEAATRWRGKKILVVCHQGVMKCLLYQLAKRSFSPEEPKLIDKDRLHTIFCHNDVLKILQLNITPETQ